MANISASIIISFYNKIDLLKLIFEALNRQSCMDFEVIIADDGSRTDVVAEIETIQQNYRFDIRHVWHDDDGWRKNIILNKAIIAASADYLIFIDGDCIPNEQFVQEHLEERAISQIISGRRILLTQKVSGKISVEKVRNGYMQGSIFFPLLIETIFAGKKTYLEHMIRLRNKSLRRFLLKDKPRFFLGCNFSLWKSDILKVNGFDERFVYPGTGEDLDLENRLKRINVTTMSKKHLVTVFHYYHVHFNTDYAPNKLLLRENDENKISFTPFGINK